MMSTMTELFYGPVEPTWIVHPQYGYPGTGKRPNEAPAGYGNPYAIYSDDTYAYRRSAPYVQRNAVPHTMVSTAPQDQYQGGPGAPSRTVHVPQGMSMYPYQAQYLVHGAGGGPGNVGNVGNMATAASGQVVDHQKQVQSSPAKAGNVLQPRNVVNVQTVHFMVPLCCEKCESRVKDQLLDLDDVQRVTCDQWKQKVTVTSCIAAERLLKRIQKIKKRSTFWPQQQSNSGPKGANGNQAHKADHQVSVDENTVPAQQLSIH